MSNSNLDKERSRAEALRAELAALEASIAEAEADVETEEPKRVVRVRVRLQGCPYRRPDDRPFEVAAGEGWRQRAIDAYKAEANILGHRAQFEVLLVGDGADARRAADLEAVNADRSGENIIGAEPEVPETPDGAPEPDEAPGEADEAPGEADEAPGEADEASKAPDEPDEPDEAPQVTQEQLEQLEQLPEQDLREAVRQHPYIDDDQVRAAGDRPALLRLLYRTVASIQGNEPPEGASLEDLRALLLKA